MNDFNARYAAARKVAIARDFANLNPEQRRGVLATEGALLLLAGAGSGKTTVLINRVANLLTYGRGSDTDEVPEWVTEDDLTFLENYSQRPTEEERKRKEELCKIDPVRPWRIFVVTFTNKAAQELKDRLKKAGYPLDEVWASTFHSACVQILRKYIDKIGYSRSFTIYDTDDCKRIIKDILKEMELDEKTFSPKEILSTISYSKNEFELPAEFAQKWAGGGDWRKEKIAAIYKKYTDRLKEANALDFDDLILLTVELLKKDDGVRKNYQKTLKYIMVDEYQDTNHAQYELLKLLVNPETHNICVVGDDDQSIYKFRGADISNILNFEKEYRNTRTIRLEQNYRSTQNILDAANAVIKNNTGRKGKTLWTDAGSGDRVLIKTVFNEQDEANFVVSSIMMDYNRGRNWKDNVILYRMNAQSNALEYAFKRNGVPYQIVGGMKFFERAEVKDMLAYLAVINNPSDDLRLRRIINNPPRGIGAKSIETVQVLAQEQSVPMMDVLRHATEYVALKNAGGKLEKFAQMINGLREAAEETELSEFYDLVCDKTDYVRALEEKNDMESRGRLENVQELKSNIAAFLENEPEDATLAGFLNEIALYTDLDSATTDNCVTMMTMHSAKGLEYPCVYVVGMEEGIFPGERVRYDDDEIEEERRLCYVAMTRAKERLTLTNARQRMLFGRTTPNAPSRFLEEVPSETADWVGKPDVNSRTLSFADDDFGGSSYSSGFGGGYGGQSKNGRIHTSYDYAQMSRPARTPNKPTVSAAKSAPTPMLKLSVGDQINHKAFGNGMVVSVTPMGGDALVEVAFDAVGTKKLMLKTASAHITKR